MFPTHKPRQFDLARLTLTLDVLSHLRAVAQGIAPADAARRYLRAGHDGRAMVLHRRAVDMAAAVARRAGLGARWRLLRLPVLATPALAGDVALEEWAERHGYEDFSLDEIRAAYEERHGPLVHSRKQAQLARLTNRRLLLLDELASHAVPSPTLADPVSNWFQDETSQRLHAAGFFALADLRMAIAQGGRWWRYIEAFGPLKAAALASQVALLVGHEPAADWSADDDARRLAAAARPWLVSWLNARTQSTQTARAYRREVERFAIWLAVERGRAIAAADADDCSAYRAFLAAVPPEWISRRNARRYAPGWAPFAAQPKTSSQRYALTVVSSFYSWLVAAGELARNPWELVNLRLPDERAAPLRSRAFTPDQWQLLLDQAERLPDAAGERMAWLLRFALATGLRPAELVAARRGDLFVQDCGWWVQVHGKGSRNRLVPVPSSALAATRVYFEQRGLSFDSADDELPLLASLDGSPGFVPYPTLADSFKRFVASALSGVIEDGAWLAGASLHWLRHTHATRAAEARVPLDVLQANLGHADPRTTAGYYRAQERRRADQMEQVFAEVV